MRQNLMKKLCALTIAITPLSAFSIELTPEQFTEFNEQLLSQVSQCLNLEKTVNQKFDSEDEKYADKSGVDYSKMCEEVEISDLLDKYQAESAEEVSLSQSQLDQSINNISTRFFRASTQENSYIDLLSRSFADYATYNDLYLEAKPLTSAIKKEKEYQLNQNNYYGIVETLEIKQAAKTKQKLMAAYPTQCDKDSFLAKFNSMAVFDLFTQAQNEKLNQAKKTWNSWLTDSKNCTWSFNFTKTQKNQRQVDASKSTDITQLHFSLFVQPPEQKITVDVRNAENARFKFPLLNIQNTQSQQNQNFDQFYENLKGLLN